MKFIIAAVVLLAATATASILPYAGLAYGAPYPFAPISTTKYIAAPHAWAAASHAIHLPGPAIAPYYAAPAPILAAHGPAPILAAHGPAIIAAPAHGASYVAANRGSVHTAPLPGHTLSQSSINLQPAAGTI